MLLEPFLLNVLFLHGIRDELATWNLIEEVYSAMRPAALVEIEEANHAFKGGAGCYSTSCQLTRGMD
jgi:predicted alpha/beta-hydrolase family hydrolase